MLVKNISEGPRGIHVMNEIIMLAPGESRDLDIVPDGKDDRNKLDSANLEVAKKSGWFEFGAKAEATKPAPKAPDAMTDQELRAYIKDRTGKDADPKADRNALLTQAKAIPAA